MDVPFRRASCRGTSPTSSPSRGLKGEEPRPDAAPALAGGPAPRPEKLGWFVAEALLRLALLGTAIGFILMLIPIAQLSSFEVETLRNALAGMSGGMAIALNVTVTGIASALLLKVEYYFLDRAIAELFAKITEITRSTWCRRWSAARDG